MEPIKKALIEKIYNGRVWNRSIRKAVNGIIIPLTNINPVISHWAVVSSIFNPVVIAGKAVLSKVWLSIATKALLSITKIIVFLFLGDIISDDRNITSFLKLHKYKF
ncbi:hypothetical protein HpBTM60_37740 [Helicobacter pylori]